ncbi:MAG: hypothetical protein ABFR97_05360 [Thermodesulfobacteriota bacterium]
MKYIAAIILIATLITMGLLYEPASKGEGEQAIYVNGRTVSRAELETKTHRQPALLGGRENITDSLITRELLIAEALRQQIDHEESFQEMLKNFYEQSLVSVLVQRQLAAISHTPTAAEIEAYQSLTGREISLELTPEEQQALSPDGADKGKAQLVTALFDELDLGVRMNILFMEEGQRSKPVKIFNDTYTITLKRISPKSVTGKTSDAATIRASISDYRREEIYANWLQGLRNRATVELAQDQNQYHSRDEEQ